MLPDTKRGDRHRLWAEIFDHAHLAIAISEACGNTFVVVNPAFTALCACRPDELIGQPLWCVIPPDLLPTFERGMAAADAADHGVIVTELLRCDGGGTPVRLEISVLRDAAGTVQSRLMCVHGICPPARPAGADHAARPDIPIGTDAPRRGRAGEVAAARAGSHGIAPQTQAEQNRLADVARRHDTLVRELHHRFKNHLHGVTGLLRQRAAKYPELAPQLSEVIAQIGTIAGVYGLQRTDENFRADLEGMVRMIAAAAGGPVDYEGRAGAKLPLREADAVPLALVVRELVANALKHRNERESARPPRVSLKTAGKRVLLSISAAPARLPAGFDYAARQGLGAGLERVAMLMPGKGAQLAIYQVGDEVRAELRLDALLFCEV
ncbi:MAG: PAS domain-containing protein [Rhodocyclaceae bacterium]|nr:PAS domain-containing protein [Rhodocyclaceae bacterium]MBX3667369.1 PAS domain-containing protein [Rhodocyclaceae bacterium]